MVPPESLKHWNSFLENDTDSLQLREMFLISIATKECAHKKGSNRQLTLNTFFDQQLTAPKGHNA
jgi:hypothetical protein